MQSYWLLRKGLQMFNVKTEELSDKGNGETKNVFEDA
jgi:hypothetical protein